jgi:hypothetical protein
MPTTSKRPRRLSDEDLQQLLTLLKGADSAELKLTVPRVRAPRHRRGAWDGPAGGPAPPGVLLRHPRPALNQHGGVVLLKLKFSPGDYGRRPVAERWFYPDASQILELSTKCAPSEGFQAAAETRTFLARQGVDLSDEQQTKTKTALRFFAHSLKATADA